MTGWVPARDWFMSRTPRERWLLSAMLAIALPLLAFLLVYRPLMVRLDEAKARHLAAVQRHGAVQAQLAMLEEAPRAVTRPTAGSLSIRITDAAAQAGVRLTANQPRGNDVAVIAVAPAPPTATLRWLRELEANGISIRELSVSPQGAGAAVVSATLAVGSGA